MLPSVVTWSPPQTRGSGVLDGGEGEEGEVEVGGGIGGMIAPPPAPEEDVMPEPFTMTLDLDFEVWSEDLEDMWKTKLCEVRQRPQHGGIPPGR